MNVRGSLYIISAPSGTGKTSLVKGLLDSLSGIKVSISHTTRSIRPGEFKDIHYHFVTEDEFKKMIVANDFIEHALVYGNYYGTSRSWVEEQLQNGIDVILEIDWQGAYQVKKQFSEVIRVFILPPTLAALEERLRTRGQDEEQVILHRLSEAKQEVKYCLEYDYLVINDKFETALSDLRSIIRAEHCRRDKQLKCQQVLLNELIN
ncbi:MAG: guanylate kinase [Gammaproteobacteria bacterium RIFCSPHIGHO2_12_FULL_35_23]|nr:MAG: guanylate kinase [Gammaproteobacteria bacterium RIFCSPHIGHO2_12_FULL_35_23]